jgi:membrane fusion protein, copper/silver efflux system
MKQLIISIFLAITLVIGVQGQHNQHHEHTNGIDKIINHYLSLKDALVESNPKAAAMIADILYDKVKDLSADELKNALLIARYTDRIRSSTNLNMQRIALNGLTLTLIETLKDYGETGITLYQQYCSMALGDGGMWLSVSEKISNPYFGQDMLLCGETIDTFN